MVHPAPSASRRRAGGRETMPAGLDKQQLSPTAALDAGTGGSVSCTRSTGRSILLRRGCPGPVLPVHDRDRVGRCRCPCFRRSDTSTAKALRRETARDSPTRGCSFSLHSSWAQHSSDRYGQSPIKGRRSLLLSSRPALPSRCSRYWSTCCHDARTSERIAKYPVAVVGLFLYVLVVGGVIALINID